MFETLVEGSTYLRLDPVELLARSVVWFVESFNCGVLSRRVWLLLVSPRGSVTGCSSNAGNSILDCGICELFRCMLTSISDNEFSRILGGWQ